MNRIVRRHYPASKLPEELREGLPADARVTVEVEQEEQRPERVMSLEEIFAMRQPTFKTGEEADDYVRSMRDEWD